MNSLVTIPPRSLSEHASKAQGIIDIGRKKHLNRNRRDSSSRRRPSWSAGGSRRRARSSQSQSGGLKPEKSSFRIEIGQPRNELKMTDNKPRAIQSPSKKLSMSKPIIIQKGESIVSASASASASATVITTTNNNNNNNNCCTSIDQETDLALHIHNNPPFIGPTYQNTFYKSVQQPCQNKYYQRVQKKRPKDTSTMTQIVLSPTRRPHMGFGTVSSGGGSGGIGKTSRTSPMDSTSSCQRKEDDHSDMHTLLTSSETATFRCDDESSFWVGTSNASECHGHHGHDQYYHHAHIGEEEQKIENSLNRNNASAVVVESFECIPHPDDVGNSRSHGSGYIWGSSSQLDMCDSGDAHDDFDSMASDRVAIEVRGQVSSDEENESKPKIPENISFYTAGSQYLSLRDLLPSSDKITEDVEVITPETAFGCKSSGESIILQDDSTETQGFQQVEEDNGNELTIDLFSKKRDTIECNCAIM